MATRGQRGQADVVRRSERSRSPRHMGELEDEDPVLEEEPRLPNSVVSKEL